MMLRKERVRVGWTSALVLLLVVYSADYLGRALDSILDSTSTYERRAALIGARKRLNPD